MPLPLSPAHLISLAPHTGAGGARSRPISARLSENIRRDTAALNPCSEHFSENRLSETKPPNVEISAVDEHIRWEHGRAFQRLGTINWRFRLSFMAPEGGSTFSRMPERVMMTSQLLGLR